MAAGRNSLCGSTDWTAKHTASASLHAQNVSVQPSPCLKISWLSSGIFQMRQVRSAPHDTQRSARAASRASTSAGQGRHAQASQLQQAVSICTGRRLCGRRRAERAHGKCAALTQT